VRSMQAVLLALFVMASLGTASAATGNVSLYSIEMSTTPVIGGNNTGVIWLAQADFDGDGIQDSITLQISVYDDNGNAYTPNTTIGEAVKIEFIDNSNITIDVTGDGSADVFDITNGTYSLLPSGVTPGYYRAKITLQFDTNGDNTVNANDTPEYRYQDVIFTTDYYYMVYQETSGATEASIGSLFPALNLLDAFNMPTRISLSKIDAAAKSFTLSIDGQSFTLREKETLKLPNKDAWIVVPEGAVQSGSVTYNIWVKYGKKPAFSSENSAVQDQNNGRLWVFSVGGRDDPARNYNIVLWDEQVPMFGLGEALDYHFVPAELSAYWENFDSVIENYDVLRVRSWIGGLFQEQTNLGRFNIWGANNQIDSVNGVLAGSRFNINNLDFVDYSQGTNVRGVIVQTKGGLQTPDAGYSVIFPRRSANANVNDYPWRGTSLSSFEEALIKHILNPGNDGLKDFTYDGKLRKFDFVDIDSIRTIGGLVVSIKK